MKWGITKTQLFSLGPIYIGLFLLVSTTYLISWSIPLEQATFIKFWYSGLIGALLLAGLLSWVLLRRQPVLLPRLYILSSFLLWLISISMQGQTADIHTAFYGALLEGPLVLALAGFVSWRIVSVFAPAYQVPRTFSITIIVLILPILLLAHTPLNASLLVTGGAAVIMPGLLYFYCLLLAAALLFGAVLLIPYGRRILPKPTAHTSAKLTFTAPTTAHDCNAPALVEHTVLTLRPRAIKQGIWISYRNYVTTAKGIIATDPKKFSIILEALCEHMMAQTERLLSVVVLLDQKYPYLHICIDLDTQKPLTKKNLAQATADITALGGVITTGSQRKNVRYRITFPVEM